VESKDTTKVASRGDPQSFSDYNAWGHDRIKIAGTTSTGLTGVQTGLTGASGRSDRCLQKGSRFSKPKKKARPSFNKLLAKYKRGGATKDRSNQPNGGKGVEAPPRHKGIHHKRGNLSQYPFVASVMPSSWYYPCFHLLIVVVCT
jgi:hypothetical protein